MENLAQPEKVLQIEPLVDLNYDSVQKQVIRKGVTERTIYPLASDSLSNTNVIFQNIAPASLTTVTERCFRVNYRLTATVVFPINAGTVANAYPIPNAVVGAGVARAFPAGAAAYVVGKPARDPVAAVGGNNVGGGGVDNYNYTMALRSFPLNSCLVTNDMKLNGGSNSIGSNDVICLQPYLMDDEELMYFECPVQRDNSAIYSGNTSADNRNPFDSRQQNSSAPTRGSFQATLVYEAVAANVCTRVYAWDIVEPLIISPLTWGKNFDDEGFANIVNISINLRIQDIQRSLSLASGMINNSSVTMSLTPAANDPEPRTTMDLLLNYNTQDPILASKMASTLYYNWDLVQVDANSNGLTGQPVNGFVNTSPGNTFYGNALRLSTIPDKIYVYIKPSKSGYNGATSQTITDTFLRITQLRVQFQNTSNILASYTEYDLWRMSVKNGLKMSWNEWRLSNGSIVIIDTVSDLGLKSDEAAGESKYNQIKIDGNYDCTPLAYAGQTQAVRYDLVTVVITGGEAVVSPNTCKFETGGVDATSVLALSTMQDSVIKAAGLRREMSPRGGSFLSNAGKYLHKGLQFIADNPDHVKTGAEYARKGLSALGVGAGIAGGQIDGGKLARHRRVY
jgi:hypothetical protein